MSEPDKTCAVCGRTITWRKAWERSWADVRYCSDACRKRKATAGKYEAEILALLATLPRGESICLAEVAKSLPAATQEALREAARRLVVKGALDIIQNGRVADASTAKGPIHLRQRR